MILQKLVEMSRYYSTWIHHGITEGLRLFFLAGADPNSI